MPSFRPLAIRRAFPAALVAAMLLTLLPAAAMATGGAPTSEVKTAEWSVLSHLNQVRARQGLRPLYMAGGVRLVARDRSRSMKRLDYFSHVSPAGRNAGDLLSSRGIGYSFWGEAIGWTEHMDLTEGAGWMVDWWKRSPTHRRLMLRGDFNYAGVGIAREGARTLWTVVFVNQPDHTPPLAGLIGPASGTRTAAPGATTVKWWGRDRRLSTRTAGLKGFTVQHKKGDDRWVALLRRSTRRSVTLDLRAGVHSFRLRAVDKRGNRSGWRAPLRVIVS